jgi:hypothetical protein
MIPHILRENGIEPAPRRGKTLSWSAFLRLIGARSQRPTSSALRC